MTAAFMNSAECEARTTGPKLVKQSAPLFAFGYLLFYLPVALALGGVAWVLGRYAWILAIIGGAMAVLLGLAALGVLRQSWLSRCQEPLGLISNPSCLLQR